jgi:membrane-bound lytic murein transglycosylase D
MSRFLESNAHLHFVRSTIPHASRSMPVAVFAVLVLVGYHASAWAWADFIPDVAYHARGTPFTPPQAAEKTHFRIEELAVLPSPTPLTAPSHGRVRSKLAGEAPRDVWDRIRRQFAMPHLTGPLVDRQVDWYLKRPDVLRGILQRSRRYLYHVVTEIERRNMPMELALLPMVESGYSPHAVSSAQASGLWQFIPDTGKRYQLVQTSTYDARRDVIASTRAALDYLQFLYELVGDWQLALASYNWGENAVIAAMERSRARGKPATYEMLTLPEETRLYVPKLQALRKIIANPEVFGITLDDVPNEPYFVAVENTRSLDLRTAAKLAEMPLTEFVALNPAFNGGIISSSDTGLILLPVDKVEVFKQNVQSVRSASAPRARMSPARSAIGAVSAPAVTF